MKMLAGIAIGVVAMLGLGLWERRVFMHRMLDPGKPVTTDSADTEEWGMDLARTAGTGTEWVREAHASARRTLLFD